jgi:outer membrane lipoprotein-sorting protein
MMTSAWAQEKPLLGQFTAEAVTTIKGKTGSEKLEIKADKIRLEKTTDKGKTSVVIMRLDKGVTWTLLDKKQYMEMSTVSTKDVPGMEKKGKDIAETKQLGDETVNGYVCEKTLIVYKDKSLGEATQWVSKKLKYAIKTEMRRDGKVESTQELKNIKEVAPPDADFEIPEGYKKFEMPAGMEDMMKGMIPK